METVLGILVGGVIGAFVLRMAFDDWLKRARLRKALTQGETQPASEHDRAPGTLARLGLDQPFRMGDAVGGRGELAGVAAEGILESISGEEFEVRKYLLTLGIPGLRLFTEGLRRQRDDIETGDAALDGLFVIHGPRELVAARLDVDARRALVAAANAGWHGRGERLARAGVRELELEAILKVGLDAARRLAPGHVEARLERTAAHDPVPRMRRLALATLVRRHPEDAATRRAVALALTDRDAILQWLARTPALQATTDAHGTTQEQWLRIAYNLLLDATRAVEVAEVLAWWGVTEALPSLGYAIGCHPDGPVKASLEAARTALAAQGAARGELARGGLALSGRDAGQLSLDD